MAMTATGRSAMTAVGLGLVVAILPACQSSCAQCPQVGVAISAAVRTTHITSPPGGGSHTFVEVLGHNFTPNAPITLSFRQYPAQNPAQEDFTEPAAANGAGTLAWTKDLFALPARKFTADPAVDVQITAKETNGACFAFASIKTQQILHPPL
jgi:hypothetical protein